MKQESEVRERPQLAFETTMVKLPGICHVKCLWTPGTWKEVNDS